MSKQSETENSSKRGNTKGKPFKGFKKRNQKERSNDSQAKVAPKGLIENLPLLVYKSQNNNLLNNFQEFQDSMQIYLAEKYGSSGLFIENGKLWEPEVTAEPEVVYDVNNRSSVSQWTLYDHSAKRMVDQVHKFNEDK